MKLSSFACAALVALAFASPALAQDTWTWRKSIPAGRTIEIKGVNGDISAIAATGNEVEVVAKKSARKSDPASVKMQVIEHEDGVTICAVYPDSDRDRKPNECLPGEKGRMNTRNNDVSVDWEVRVPRSVEFVGRTVNGGVRASGLSADASAFAVNGSVRVSTTGLARASTVNGSVTVRMGRSNWTDELHFATVNGGITLELPDPLETTVEASTVNGSFTSDWPLAVSGRFGPKRISGKIGNGGRALELSTVNGDIELRKSN